MIKIFNTKQSVFDLKDLWNILWEANYDNLKSKIAYYVKKGYLSRIRKWIFVKENFDVYELACKIYTPSYVSFETVLLDYGIIYQPSDEIFLASYLSRNIELEYKWKTIKLVYRKLKDNLLYDYSGIIKKDYYNIASSNRAVKDIKYLKPDFYFDNLKKNG